VSYRWISVVAGAVGLIVLSLVGAGCGGGSNETTSDITKAQFVKKAGLICTEHKQERTKAANVEYNQKVEDEKQAKPGSAAAKVQTENSEKLITELLKNSILPSLRSQQEDLESLEEPASDDAKIEKMLKSLEKGIDELEQEGAGGILGNQFDDFEKESQKYGLNCKVI